MNEALNAQTAENLRLVAELDLIKSPPECEIEGEVFIVTKGGQNYKLGLVEVGLFSAETVLSHLKAKEQTRGAERARRSPDLNKANEAAEAADRARNMAFDKYSKSITSHNNPTLENAWRQATAEHQRAWSKYSALFSAYIYYSSGDFYFDGLPRPLLTAKSNSDGRFALRTSTTIPVVLGAAAQRTVGKDVEKYFWLVPVPTEGRTKITVVLSNDNLSSTGSSESLIYTDD